VHDEIGDGDAPKIDPILYTILSTAYDIIVGSMRSLVMSYVECLCFMMSLTKPFKCSSPKDLNVTSSDFML
jgi:hypothetical protein